MGKILLPFEDCKHEHQDQTWSHGNMARCIDCGAVEEDGLLAKTDWRDIVTDIALFRLLKERNGSLPENLDKSLEYFEKYALDAEKHCGIAYSATILAKINQIKDNINPQLALNF